MKKKKRPLLSQTQLREIVQEIDAADHPSTPADYVALSMVNPHLGLVHWHLQAASVEAIKAQRDDAALMVRIYGNTDVPFDPQNTQFYFDITLTGLEGVRYFGIDQPARIYLAEIGLRSEDGAFHALTQSNTVTIEQTRPMLNGQSSSAFLADALPGAAVMDQGTQPALAEQDAPDAATDDAPQRPLNVAVIFIGLNLETSFGNPLGVFVENISRKFRDFGASVQFFAPVLNTTASGETLQAEIEALSAAVFDDVYEAHQEQPFDVIHSHNWPSAPAGLEAAKRLNLPLILSLHNTEYQRYKGVGKIPPSAAAIIAREQAALEEADLVITPHETTRRHVVANYQADPDKVAVIPDVLIDKSAPKVYEQAAYKRQFSLPPEAPVVLFAGDLSPAAGADLLGEAMAAVGNANEQVVFAIAGDGPLADDLKIQAAGLGRRCRFFGRLAPQVVESLLMGSDIIAIPAGTPQADELAQLALERGKLVLTTEQTNLNSIADGQNGLVVAGDSGAIAQGLRQLLANDPEAGGIVPAPLILPVGQTSSLDDIATLHYSQYQETVAKQPKKQPVGDEAEADVLEPQTTEDPPAEETVMESQPVEAKAVAVEIEPKASSFSESPPAVEPQVDPGSNPSDTPADEA